MITQSRLETTFYMVVIRLSPSYCSNSLFNCCMYKVGSLNRLPPVPLGVWGAAAAGQLLCPSGSGSGGSRSSMLPYGASAFLESLDQWKRWEWRNECEVWWERVGGRVSVMFLSIPIHFLNTLVCAHNFFITTYWTPLNFAGLPCILFDDCVIGRAWLIIPAAL